MTKINSFVAGVANGAFNLGSHQLKIALTNTPHTASWTKLSDLTEISYTNLSGANPLNLTLTSSSQTSGLYKLILQDLLLTATGAVGPFEYIYIYDNGATNKDLICYYDYGSPLTLAATDTFTVNFDNTNGVLQLT